LVYVSGGLRLSGLSQEFISFLARGFDLGFLSEARGFLRQPIREGQRALVATSLHPPCSIPCEGGSATGDLITDDCHGTVR
jgi:hypothetical protein